LQILRPRGLRAPLGDEVARDHASASTSAFTSNKFDVVAKRRSQPDERGERGVRALLREQSAHDLRVSVDGRRKAGLADAGLLARGVECPHYLVDGVHLCACLGTVVIQTEIIVLAGDETHAEIVAKHIVEDEWPARDLRKSSFRFQAQPMSHLPVGWDENEFPEEQLGGARAHDQRIDRARSCPKNVFLSLAPPAVDPLAD
jgi:hypothetical protein